ncbi:alpha/beta hydrolase [Asanoa ishikariensis]|uniref:Pimeloyl-ACP methyl ester carboxylesterase n=1 Tax=Asanoa ishikariensis TaxID=137265 RepID=A0A1H3TNV5_9ACTN|nr:alpha/beta hydrolase [Asanoa ishikariensis]GIF62111.1 alpha/beta hydrolase [Asanoa ishikariensis]SDZ51578.1 Pimeloyl-ACP methyl ester carboxylesterase [Asanoa ishikariensis]
MSNSRPTVVLVHGAFAESASWSGVIERLRARSVDVVAAANPLRSIPGDAAYVRDVLASIDGPVVLVGHSYGGMVITEAAAGNDKVAGLVYVCAFAPDHGESALELSTKFPGGTLGEALTGYPVATGGNELAIRPEAFHHQFAADVTADQAAVMSATQRPVTEVALSAGLPTATAAWASLPSWFVFSDQDLNIPVALHRWMAQRAGAKGVHEVAGASHALSVSQPGAVTDAILEAVEALAA